MSKLREVRFWTHDKNIKYRGFFHTWGRRGNEVQQEFFAVVEDELGHCLELDAVQIKFMDPPTRKEK